MDETTDLVKPGGLVFVTDHTVIPIFKANEDAPAEGGSGESSVTSAAIKGEPGTGYEAEAGHGPFACHNCEYFRVSDHSCGQKDMMAKSKLPRTKDERPIVDPKGCCEYVDRLGEETHERQPESSGASPEK